MVGESAEASTPGTLAISLSQRQESGRECRTRFSARMAPTVRAEANKSAADRGSREIASRWPDASDKRARHRPHQPTRRARAPGAVVAGGREAVDAAGRTARTRDLSTVLDDGAGSARFGWPDNRRRLSARADNPAHCTPQMLRINRVQQYPVTSGGNRLRHVCRLQSGDKHRSGGLESRSHVADVQRRSIGTGMVCNNNIDTTHAE